MDRVDAKTMENDYRVMNIVSLEIDHVDAEASAESTILNSFDSGLTVDGDADLKLVVGDSLDMLMALNHGNAYMSVLFYASWCPFSRVVRPNFMLSSKFPQIQHIAVEHSEALPS